MLKIFVYIILWWFSIGLIQDQNVSVPPRGRSSLNILLSECFVGYSSLNDFLDPTNRKKYIHVNIKSIFQLKNKLIQILGELW